MGKHNTTKSDGNVLRFAHYLAQKGKNCTAHFGEMECNSTIFDKNQGWIEVILAQSPYVTDIDENNNERKRMLYIKVEFDWNNMGWITVACQGIIPFDFNKEEAIFKDLDEESFIDKVDKINSRYRVFDTGIMEAGYLIDEIVIEDYKNEILSDEDFEVIYNSITDMENVILNHFNEYI